MHHARPQFRPCQPCRKHRRHYRQDRHHRPANVGRSVVMSPPDRPAQGNVGLPQLASPARIGLSPPKARIVCQWAYRPFNVAKTRRRHHRPQAGHASRRSRYSEPVPPLSKVFLTLSGLLSFFGCPCLTSTACSLACRVGHTVQCDPTPLNPVLEYRIYPPKNLSYCLLHYRPIVLYYRHDTQRQYQRDHHERHRLLPSIDRKTG